MKPADPDAWADAIRDSTALVAAVRADDWDGVRAILRNADRDLVAISLAKLCAEALDDLDVSPEWRRTWATASVNRP